MKRARDAGAARCRTALVGALRAGDAAAAAAGYAPDARLVLPAIAPVAGPAAIEAFWHTGIGAGMVGFDLVPGALAPQSSYRCESGRYLFRVAAPHEPESEQHGRYLTVLRRGPHGLWERVLDVFDPDA